MKSLLNNGIINKKGCEFKMKKIINFLFIIFMVIMLPSCKKEEKADVIISEFIEDGLNSAIELYNTTNKNINLKEYKLYGYFNNVVKIKLSGIINAKSTYVIAYNSSSLKEELKLKTNLLVDTLIFSGKNAVALINEGKTLDIIGDKKSNYAYCENRGIVRKTNFLRGTSKFDEYEWIRYPKTTLSNLGNVDTTVSEEELLEGPKLTVEDYARPFINETNNTLGGGGVVEVTLSSTGDGDTSNFNFPPSLGIGTYRVRYQNVDTPETMSHLTQEWGIPAKEFTNEALRFAVSIQIQSVLNGSLYETFDRMLGWVWIDNKLHNFNLVKNGYSRLQFADTQNMYKGIYYTDYMYHAELYAKRNKLGLHGQKDPYWNYETNQPK